MTDADTPPSSLSYIVDEPIEILMAVTERQSAAIVEKINSTETRLFYIKTSVEYGELGALTAQPR